MSDTICTRLFGLTPLSLRTGMQESFPSYLSRLADLHGISMGCFFKREISLTGRVVPDCNSTRLLVANKVTTELARKVAVLTGVPEVEILVQPALTARIDLNKGLQREISWCSQCLWDWSSQGQPLYRPLLWSLSRVTFCPIHRLPLVNRCPVCHYHFFQVSSRRWHWSCNRCGQPLFKNAKGTHGNQPGAKFEIARSDLVLELLQWGTKKLDLPSSTFPQNLRTACAEVGGIEPFAQFIDIGTTKLWNWLKGTKPELSALVRLSSQFKVPLHSWFSNSVARTAFKAAEPTARTVRKRRVSILELEKALRKVLRQSGEPPSLAKVAARLGVNYTACYNRCPKLAKMVSRRFKLARAKRAAERKRAHEQIVAGAINKLHGRFGIPPVTAVRRYLEERGFRLGIVVALIYDKLTKGPHYNRKTRFGSE